MKPWGKRVRKIGGRKKEVGKKEKFVEFIARSEE